MNDKVTACPLVLCPERLQFYSLSNHCQACAARVKRAREGRERRALRERQARVISGTGDTAERRELAAIVRWLGSRD
jgi:hypothetical protein